MECFLGWVTGVVGDLFDWVVGIGSSAVNGSGSSLQVMGLASVLMQFFLDLRQLGGFPSWYGQEVLAFTLLSYWSVV